MNVQQIKVSLPAKDESGKTRSFLISEVDGQLLFSSEDGQEIATLHVASMTKDVRDEEGDYHTKWSDNFYLCFRAFEAVAKRECDAMVWIDPIPQP